MRAMIEARDLSKTFQGLPVVRSVSFRVERGEVVGVVGPQGSGKTTLLRMLAGFVMPSAGEGVVAGRSTGSEPFRIKSHVGYLAGEAALPPRLTPRELLQQAGELHHLEPEELQSRLEALLTAFELERSMELPIATLRAEQRQRLALARALLNDPPALILDEPTHGLDMVGARFLLLAIRAVRDAGKAVLLATRSLSDAEYLCDRVVLLHGGQVLNQGTLAELCAHTNARTFTEAVLRQLPLLSA
jgi:ABC-type multidrug transport system ATPase subunit